MGKVTGFLEIDRREAKYQPASDRIRHFREFTLPLPDAEVANQASRCMDCGVPFCHGPNGCPIHNQIPDWNDLVYNGNWEEAARNLHSTNNFPEFTGRICPAPCEEACTLNLEDVPVTIKTVEQAIADKAWKAGWIKPEPAAHKTGKKVAVVGSGPAGMAAAQQLARAGHEVHVYEREPKAGGLLRYGIPDFKLEKHQIDRRISQMEAEGVEFAPSTYVGKPTDPVADGLTVRTPDSLLAEFDAVVMSGGSETPRDLPVPGRELSGVYFAMDFLRQQNKAVAGDRLTNQTLAKGKHVVVIGGGDTGSDCVGTSNRHGAASVTQFELLPQPPESENKAMTWPYWPLKMRTSSSHEEGCERDWSVTTKLLKGSNGKVEKLVGARVEWFKDESTGQMKMREVEGSEFEIKADLVLLAMGFVSPVQAVLDAFGVDRDARGNVRANTDDYRTNVEKVFTAGDMRRGQSLVVWAIREGRQCARSVDAYLMGSSDLPR